VVAITAKIKNGEISRLTRSTAIDLWPRANGLRSCGGLAMALTRKSNNAVRRLAALVSILLAGVNRSRIQREANPMSDFTIVDMNTIITGMVNSDVSPAR
jgi:hypothetical protein